MPCISVSILMSVSVRHGTIWNFRSISISIFSEIGFSKSISISKFFKKILQYQNQYQYQNFPILNIKINIKIFKIQKQYQNQYQYCQNIDIDIENQNFLGLRNLVFNLLWLLCHLGPMGHHLIPIAPQHPTLGSSLGTMGTSPRLMAPNLWSLVTQPGTFCISPMT